MDLDFKNLNLFVRVASIGAIGRAGDELGLSSTNASQRIQALESELGVKLFYRSTRSVTLTHDGEVFLEHAKRILDDIEETRNVFRSDANKIEGKIRLTVSASYGRLYIVPFLPELLRLYPDLRIEIDFTDKLTDIVEQGYDVAFRVGELQSTSLVARRISDNPAFLVAAPAYVEQFGQPTSPQDLANHTCIPFSRMNDWQFTDTKGKLHQVTVSGPVNVNWGDAVADLVEAGVGIGVGSLWHAGPSIKAGRLVRLLPDYQVWPETRIWAVRPPGKITPARVKIFLDYIETCIRTTNKQRYGDLLN